MFHIRIDISNIVANQSGDQWCPKSYTKTNPKINVRLCHQLQQRSHAEYCLQYREAIPSTACSMLGSLIILCILVISHTEVVTTGYL